MHILGHSCRTKKSLFKVPLYLLGVTTVLLNNVRLYDFHIEAIKLINL